MHYGRGDNYGRGDYYRGDYYRGDFFGSLFKGIKGIARTALGAATGGVSELALQGLQAGINLVSRGAHPNLPAPKASFAMTAPPQAVQTGLANFGQPGSVQTGILNVETGIPSTVGGFALPTTKGYHPNRSTYETRGGGTSRWPKELELHPRGTVLVRNRRMNVGNARALKRALRRAHGFARLARRVMSFTHPHAGKSAHFKFRRRKK